MTRLKQLTKRTDVSEQHQEIFNQIVGSRGRISGPFSVLLHSPEVAGRAAHLGAYLRFESVLPDDIRETAIITAAKEMNCEYEWAYHVTIADDAGVPHEVIEAIRTGESISNLAGSYSAVISYGRELLSGKRVSDSTFGKNKALFGKQGITELTATMGYYGMLACALNAFEVMPEPGRSTLRD